MKIPKLPFGRTEVQKIEGVIASLAKLGEQLAAKRITAQQTLDKAVKARQDALLTVDFDDQRALDKLQAAVDSATSALAGIDDALAILAQQKAEAESQLTAEREHIERAKAAEEISAAAKAIAARVAPMLSAMREVASALLEIDHLSFEVGQLGQHLSGVAGEAEIAFAFVLPELGRFSVAVKDSSMAIPRRPKAVEPIAVIEPAPPTQALFLLKSVKFRDHAGKVRFGGQYEDCEMPVQLAQRAMRYGAATTTSDPGHAQLRGARGGDFNFAAPDVVDLDAIEEAKGMPYISSDHTPLFTEIDRSAEARTISISVPRV
jgi:hypothetical protein